MPKNTSGLRRGGGRVKGVPNKATVEIRDFARKFLADPQGQAKLLEQYRRGKLHPTVLTLLYHYAHGKPKDTVEVTGNEGGPLAFTINLAYAANTDV